MKVGFLLISFCFLLSLSLAAQDYAVLPTYVLRSQLLIESGIARPQASSWLNRTQNFVFHGEKTGYFQLAYDRRFIYNQWHLRASVYRANTEAYWSLADGLLVSFPAMGGGEPEPKEVGLRVQQGVTETAIGFGYGFAPGIVKGVFLKSTFSLGIVSRGTSSFASEYHYKGTNGDTVDVRIITSKPQKSQDIAMMAKLDIELGYAISEVHSISLCAAFTQYGFSQKRTSSKMMESATLFQVESREYTLLTAMRTRTFTFGLRYSYRFNLR